MEMIFVKIKNKRTFYGILFGIALTIGFLLIILSEGSYISFGPHN